MKGLNDVKGVKGVYESKGFEGCTGFRVWGLESSAQGEKLFKILWGFQDMCLAGLACPKPYNPKPEQGWDVPPERTALDRDYDILLTKDKNSP